jgi:hypothetical protein
MGVECAAAGADTWRVRRFLPDQFRLAVNALVLATVVDAIFVSRGWRNPDFALFAGGGKTMLSGAWAHTFHRPEIQAAPLELLTARVLVWSTGWSVVALAITTELALVGALIATGRSIIGRRAVPIAFVIVAALLLGVIPDAFATGHFAEPVAAIIWLLAAREARAGRVERAGLLVGVSAGFELWGILGITVLALAPSMRRAAVGVAIACATIALMIVPFMLAGDFNMFAFEWRVANGPIHLLVGTGHHFGWPLRLLQGFATVAVGVVLARLLAKSLSSIFIVPAATVTVRLLLDPMGLFYYWDPVIVLALLGAAAAFAQREALRSRLESWAPLRGRIGVSSSTPAH